MKKILIYFLTSSLMLLSAFTLQAKNKSKHKGQFNKPFVVLTSQQKSKINKKFITEYKKNLNVGMFIKNFYKYMPKEQRKSSLSLIRKKKIRLSTIQPAEVKIKGNKLVFSHKKSKGALSVEVMALYPTVLNVNGKKLVFDVDEDLGSLITKFKVLNKKISWNDYGRYIDIVFPKAHAILPALFLPVIVVVGGVSITFTDVAAVIGLGFFAHYAFSENIDYTEEMRKVVNGINNEMFLGDIKDIKLDCRAKNHNGANSIMLEIIGEDDDVVTLSQFNKRVGYMDLEDDYAFSRSKLGVDSAIKIKKPFSENSEQKVKILTAIMKQCCNETGPCETAIDQGKFSNVDGQLVFAGDKSAPTSIDTIKGGVR